jgi:hypothetical protein
MATVGGEGCSSEREGGNEMMTMMIMADDGGWQIAERREADGRQRGRESTERIGRCSVQVQL